MISGGAARAAIVVCAVLAAGGCGRRGALEPAPGETAAQPQQPAASDANLAAAQLPRRKKTPRIIPPAGPAALDWLL